MNQKDEICLGSFNHREQAWKWERGWESFLETQDAGEIKKEQLKEWLVFYMDEITMIRTWRDEKANLDLKRLSNQGWRDERSSFYYPFLQWETISTWDEFLLYTHAKGLPLRLGACY